MDWESIIAQSQELERKELYDEAARLLRNVLEHIQDRSILGREVIHACKLFISAGNPENAISLAQDWSERNGYLPGIVLEELNTIIHDQNNRIQNNNDRTNREINNRRTSHNEPALVATPSDSPSAIVTSTNSDILQYVSDNILALPEPDFRINCARALVASILVDIEHDPPQPYSPVQIAVGFGVTLEVQRRLGICLTKKSALEFLELLKIAPKKGNFNRRLSKRGYENVFGRDPSSIGNKPYVFTYAEILHFEDITFRLQVPTALQNLLN